MGKDWLKQNTKQKWSKQLNKTAKQSRVLQKEVTIHVTGDLKIQQQKAINAATAMRTKTSRGVNWRGFGVLAIITTKTKCKKSSSNNNDSNEGDIKLSYSTQCSRFVAHVLRFTFAHNAALKLQMHLHLNLKLARQSQTLTPKHTYICIHRHI